tara:strand:- start:179 stop:436 length:258 start_codon:yes stop_codon:yes gene_type:complete
MLISKWKENFEGTGVWSATNCLTMIGNTVPKIIVEGGDLAPASLKGATVFGAFGEVLNCGEPFESFEEAARWMETVFTFEVKING